MRSGLVRGFLSVGIWTFVSRLSGFVRDILMAAWLGTGAVADSPALTRFARLTVPGLVSRPRRADGQMDWMMPSVDRAAALRVRDRLVEGIAVRPGKARRILVSREGSLFRRCDNEGVIAQVAARRGFGGHDGVVGEFGAKYRIKPSDRLTLWAGAEADFANEKFVDTYFGISADESAASGHAPFSPAGGVYAHSLSLEGRYALTDSLALVGEAEYARLVGDAADAPFIEEKSQPSLRLGVVHRFDLRF